MRSNSSESHSSISSRYSEQSAIGKVVDEKNQTYTLKLKVSDILLKNLNLLEKLGNYKESEQVGQVILRVERQNK